MSSGTPISGLSEHSSAEKGLHENELNHENKASETPKPPEDPYAKYSRSEAKVWSLYMTETEAEDKELVQSWKTGLDSLLVFAGLFAGVLAAFLLESRKGLQEDPQQVLLREIKWALRNESSTSTPLPFRPTTSSLSVNSLWFISLTLTLVSALGAVIAKGWIDIYLPASAGKSFHDACERHLRVTRAYQWHLDSVLALIPLLLQLSLLLFIAGLIIFVLGDSKGIGAAVFALNVVAIVVYTVMTVLPRLSPACPFRTPLSTFIPGTDKMARYKRYLRSSYTHFSSPSGLATSISGMISNLRYQPTADHAEVMILAWIIANSDQEDAMNEAVKAIAGLDPGRSMNMHSAMRESGAIPRLCRRLEKLSDFLPGRDGEALEERTIMKGAFKQVELVKVIKSLVPYVVDSLKGTDLWARGSAMLALGKVSKQPELSKEIENVVPCIVELLKDTELCFSAQRALGEISKQPELSKAMENVVPCIVELLRDSEFEVGYSAAIALGEISKQPELVNSIERMVPHIVDMLKDERPLVRLSAKTALGEISEQPELSKAIENAVLRIIELLNDSNFIVCRSVVTTLGEISKQPELAKVVENAVPRIVELLEHTKSDVRVRLLEVIKREVPHVAAALTDHK